MINIADNFKFVLEYYETIKSQNARSQYMRHFIYYETLLNLDLLTVINLKSLESREAKKELVFSLSTKSCDVIETLGIPLKNIFKTPYRLSQTLWKLPNEEDDQVEDGRPNPQNSQAFYYERCETYLYNFYTRKIRILKIIYQNNLDELTKAKIQARLTDIGMSLTALANKLEGEFISGK